MEKLTESINSIFWFREAERNTTTGEMGNAPTTNNCDEFLYIFRNVPAFSSRLSYFLLNETRFVSSDWSKSPGGPYMSCQFTDIFQDHLFTGGHKKYFRRHEFRWLRSFRRSIFHRLKKDHFGIETINVKLALQRRQPSAQRTDFALAQHRSKLLKSSCVGSI